MSIEITARKDWKGNRASALTTVGAKYNKDSIIQREKHDFYATSPKAMYQLLEKEKFAEVIHECACGQGHLSTVLEDKGHTVFSSDLIDRGYKNTYLIDFLDNAAIEKNLLFLKTMSKDKFDIITNPPFRYAEEFVRQALKVVSEGQKVAMFLRIQFLESKKRAALFAEHPVKTVYVASNRIECGINGNFTGKPSAACYAWFVWEKGYTGDTCLKHFN